MAVADAHPVHLALGERSSDHGATHAVEGGGLLDGCAQRIVGLGQAFVEYPRRLRLAELAGEVLVEGGDDEIAGDIAGGVAAHAICHHHQRGALRLSRVVIDVGDQKGVFLIVPGPIDLITGDFEFEIHARVP